MYIIFLTKNLNLFNVEYFVTWNAIKRLNTFSFWPPTFYEFAEQIKIELTFNRDVNSSSFIIVNIFHNNSTFFVLFLLANYKIKIVNKLTHNIFCGYNFLKFVMSMINYIFYNPIMSKWPT